MKTYKIINALNGKRNIAYYDDSDLESVELYSQPGFIADIKLGYTNQDGAKWAEMLRDLLTPGGTIITRMRATAKLTLNMSVEYSTVMAVLQDGVNGFPDEATLQTLLRMAWGFTAQEKATLNSYFSANNFTIQLP